MASSGRFCKDGWLKTLDRYVEETESPRSFWMWSGIFTICAALQRRVWAQFGMENIYPGLYLLTVAEPGWVRKGPPVGLAKKMLQEVDVAVFVDSPSKRAMTQALAELSLSQHFEYEGTPVAQSAMAVISKEMSSLLAIDPKGMIEALTDIYDVHDDWTYKTAHKGTDKIRNVCVSCYIATTPGWMSRNLPDEAIGGGFTSRFVIIHDSKRYKHVPWPPPPPVELYRALISDLAVIKRLKGPFKLEPGAVELYTHWYETLKDKAVKIGDERVYSNYSRAHVIAVRVAMALHVSYSNELIITETDMKESIKILEKAYESAPGAFASHGRSQYSYDTDRIRTQVRIAQAITFSALLKKNYRNTDKVTLKNILENLEEMGHIQQQFNPATGQLNIIWLGD